MGIQVNNVRVNGDIKLTVDKYGIKTTSLIRNIARWSLSDVEKAIRGNPSFVDCRVRIEMENVECNGINLVKQLYTN